MQLDHADYKHAHNELLIGAVEKSNALFDHHADMRERLRSKNDERPSRLLPNLFKRFKVERADMGPDVAEVAAELDKNANFSHAAMVQERDEQRAFRARYMRELQEQQWA